MFLREAEIKARDLQIKAREEADAASRLQAQEVRILQERMHHREENMERKLARMSDREVELEEKLARQSSLNEDIAARETEVRELIREQRRNLSEISGLSPDGARRKLLNSLELEMESERADMVRRYQDEARAEAEGEARKIITGAIERYAAEQCHHVTTSTVSLPTEEMKGRIIGKEGRNIRCLESLLGVDIVIDDTPGVVLVSAFDPLRREIARQTLERLVTDGRIHPAHIESTISKVRSETAEIIRKAGGNALHELGLRRVPAEVIEFLGKLNFRTSYSQNVLRHSVEVAHLMAGMASELGLDIDTAKRIGLFHDIGKAFDHDQEGTHALLGAGLLRRHDIDPVIVNAVASHHGEVEARSLYDTLIRAADAIAASRPGARSETTQIYLKRLRDLEKIARSYPGVESCYAIQAGRELRVIVEPDELTEDEALQLARQISQEIESTLTYTGQVKVTIIRETRCVEFAR